MKEYKPKLHRISMEVSALAIVLAILHFTERTSLTFLIIFGIVYLAYRIGFALIGICGVILEEEKIVIRYLIPFKKDEIIKHSEIESYAPF